MEAERLALEAAQLLEDVHQELDEVAQQHAAELAALQKAKKKSSMKANRARQEPCPHHHHQQLHAPFEPSFELQLVHGWFEEVKQRLDAAGVSLPPTEAAHDLHAALQMAKAGEQRRASARSLIMSELRKLQG